MAYKQYMACPYGKHQIEVPAGGDPTFLCPVCGRRLSRPRRKTESRRKAAERKYRKEQRTLWQ